jgi:diacylglycerol kinase family enzyme
LAKLNLPKEQIPRLSLIPLGTANELCRVTGWRIDVDEGAFNEKEYLYNVLTGDDIQVDKWNVYIRRGGEVVQSIAMMCFASVGQDAEIAFQFQRQRETDPQSTNSVFKVRAHLLSNSHPYEALSFRTNIGTCIMV